MKFFLKYRTPNLVFGCSRGSSHFVHTHWDPLQYCRFFPGCNLAFKCHWVSGTVSTMRRLSHWVLGFLRAWVIKKILLPFELKHFPELPSPRETLSIWGRALKYLHQYCQNSLTYFRAVMQPLVNHLSMSKLCFRKRKKIYNQNAGDELCLAKFK